MAKLPEKYISRKPFPERISEMKDKDAGYTSIGNLAINEEGEALLRGSGRLYQTKTATDDLMVKCITFYDSYHQKDSLSYDVYLESLDSRTYKWVLGSADRWYTIPVSKIFESTYL